VVSENTDASQVTVTDSKPAIALTPLTASKICVITLTPLATDCPRLFFATIHQREFSQETQNKCVTQTCVTARIYTNILPSKNTVESIDFFHNHAKVYPFSQNRVFM